MENLQSFYANSKHPATPDHTSHRDDEDLMDPGSEEESLQQNIPEVHSDVVPAEKKSSAFNSSCQVQDPSAVNQDANANINQEVDEITTLFQRSQTVRTASGADISMDEGDDDVFNISISPVKSSTIQEYQQGEPVTQVQEIFEKSKAKCVLKLSPMKPFIPQGKAPRVPEHKDPSLHIQTKATNEIADTVGAIQSYLNEQGHDNQRLHQEQALALGKMSTITQSKDKKKAQKRASTLKPEEKSKRSKVDLQEFARIAYTDRQVAMQRSKIQRDFATGTITVEAYVQESMKLDDQSRNIQARHELTNMAHTVLDGEDRQIDVRALKKRDKAVKSKSEEVARQGTQSLGEAQPATKPQAPKVERAATEGSISQDIKKSVLQDLHTLRPYVDRSRIGQPGPYNNQNYGLPNPNSPPRAKSIQPVPRISSSQPAVVTRRIEVTEVSFKAEISIYQNHFHQLQEFAQLYDVDELPISKDIRRLIPLNVPITMYNEGDKQLVDDYARYGNMVFPVETRANGGPEFRYRQEWTTQVYDEENQTYSFCRAGYENIITFPGYNPDHETVPATFQYQVLELEYLSRIPSRVILDLNKLHPTNVPQLNYVDEDDLQADGGYLPRHHEIQNSITGKPLSCPAVGCCLASRARTGRPASEEAARTRKSKCTLCRGYHKNVMCPIFMWPKERQVEFARVGACHRCGRQHSRGDSRNPEPCTSQELCSFCTGEHQDALCESQNAYLFSAFMCAFWRSRAIKVTRSHQQELERRVRSMAHKLQEIQDQRVSKFHLVQGRGGGPATTQCETVPVKLIYQYYQIAATQLGTQSSVRFRDFAELIINGKLPRLFETDHNMSRPSRPRPGSIRKCRLIISQPGSLVSKATTSCKIQRARNNSSTRTPVELSSLHFPGQEERRKKNPIRSDEAIQCRSQADLFQSVSSSKEDKSIKPVQGQVAAVSPRHPVQTTKEEEQVTPGAGEHKGRIVLSASGQAQRCLASSQELPTRGTSGRTVSPLPTEGRQSRTKVLPYPMLQCCMFSIFPHFQCIVDIYRTINIPIPRILFHSYNPTRRRLSKCTNQSHLRRYSVPPVVVPTMVSSAWQTSSPSGRDALWRARCTTGPAVPPPDGGCATTGGHPTAYGYPGTDRPGLATPTAPMG